MDDNLHTAVIPMTMEFNEDKPLPSRNEEIYSIDKENLEQLEFIVIQLNNIYS
jgi:hypothetical protein